MVDRTLHPDRQAAHMSSSTIIGLEMGTTLVAVIGFGLWELWKLKRDKTK
jgi:hypothetical protein